MFDTFNIAEMFSQAMTVWSELKSVQSKEEIDRIFETGVNIAEKINDMFDIGIDISEDIANVTTIIFGMIERMKDDSQARALPKPMQEVTTFNDVLDVVQNRYVEYRLNEHYTDN